MKDTTRAQILAELKAARDIADAAVAADRDLTGEERGKVDAHLKLATELKARDANQAELAKQLSDLSDGIGLNTPPDDKPEPVGYVPLGKGNDNTKRKGLGETFVGSPEFKALMSNAPNGRFGEQTKVGTSQPFGVKDLLTGVNRTTSAGALLTPQQLGLLDPFYQRPLTIRDLVTPGTTATDTIEYVKLVSVTNNAAAVAEATTSAVIGSGDPAVTTVQGGLKPESAMVFEKATTNVKTLAHWIPATKRALSDASQIQTLIDAFLIYGLDEELEDQIVSGNGVGENLLGVSATSGIQTQAAPAGAETIFDTTRKARTKVQIGGRSIPTAYVFNPINWQTIDLLRDGNERFYGAGPFQVSTPTLWGLPVVESEAVPAGTAYVADWRKAVLWDRQQASIQVTDSHSDFFIRNLVAILAELRAAFGILRPSAFVKITL